MILQKGFICYDQEANGRSNETIQVLHVLSTKPWEQSWFPADPSLILYMSQNFSTDSFRYPAPLYQFAKSFFQVMHGMR